MKWLTRQEQAVLAMILFLLLTGLAVKAYRAARAADADTTVQAAP